MAKMPEPLYVSALACDRAVHSTAGRIKGLMNPTQRIIALISSVAPGTGPSPYRAAETRAVFPHRLYIENAMRILHGDSRYQEREQNPEECDASGKSDSVHPGDGAGKGITIFPALRNCL